MGKVVINTCFGGFDLSNEALDRMYELGYDMELNPNYDPRPGVEWYNRKEYKECASKIKESLDVDTYCGRIPSDSSL